jgi:hypothetical protein
MAGRAAGERLIMGYPLEMAEVAYIHGNLNMRSLNDIGVTTSAMEFYAPFHLCKVGFVVKGDAPLGKRYLRINHPFLMTSGLEAILIRHVGKRTGIV